MICSAGEGSRGAVVVLRAPGELLRAPGELHSNTIITVIKLTSFLFIQLNVCFYLFNIYS